MEHICMNEVNLTSGYLFGKQELNRTETIYAVYDRFLETGRISAFDFDYSPDDPDSIKPHFFWDSDVAKWIEGVANIIKKFPAPDLEAKADAIIQKIQEHQGKDGYFNIYFTVVEPEKRFTERKRHELYCAGHLIEAAIAYADATGKRVFLDCMERYADYIYQVFVEEQSAKFTTPGHEEIELALLKLYQYTRKKKYLDLAKFFIDMRGVAEEPLMDAHRQSHKPVRQQREAEGHAVRAMYLYTGMAMLAAQTNEEELKSVCRDLWEDVISKKMYITGGIGSTFAGESFTVPYDLPNDTAYAETCAAIGLIYFSNAMLALENNAKYADVIERTLYNGVLSGLSADGTAFFYENPLEINLREQFESGRTKKRLPITNRVQVFSVSCCPPNLNRLLSSLGNYIYGLDDNTLYVNQYVSSTLRYGEIECKQQTEYPNNGRVCLSVKGIEKVALRIPQWCDRFKINQPYRMDNGYAIVENHGDEIILDMEIAVKIIYANPRVRADVRKACITRGPIVYCAESVDNGEELYRYLIPKAITTVEKIDKNIGLVTLQISCKKMIPSEVALYSTHVPLEESATLKLVPYNYFANRGESDMAVWLTAI